MLTKSLVFDKKFFIPLALLAWLLVSLTFTLLIPRADAAYDPSNGCPSSNDEAMDQVYSPQRFRIINLCQQATATVTYFEEWSDGDWNVYVKNVNPSSLWSESGRANLRTWKQAQQTNDHEAADMIYEAIPRDLGSDCGVPPDGGNLGQPPSKDTSITVHGVYVTDKWHSWTEIHPITQITNNNNGQTCTRSASDNTSTSSGSSGSGPSWKEGNTCTWGWGGNKPRCY